MGPTAAAEVLFSMPGRGREAVEVLAEEARGLGRAVEVLFPGTGRRGEAGEVLGGEAARMGCRF